jgi:hypothetical protein
MVLRVDRDLLVQLDVISDRLLMETAYDHPRAAVVRGLVVLGLVAVEGAPHLASLFAGVRIARGRKRGDRLVRS